MKIILKCILMLTVCHQGLSTLAPSSEGGSGCVNNYFQAPAQTFHMYNDGTIQKKQLPKIPDDYEVHPGFGAYKFHLSALTWNKARHACLNEGAHLAVITSTEEEAILRKIQQSKNAEYAWIGVHDQYEKDDWVTVFDQQLSTLGYVHWAEGEPNNLKNVGEHCVAASVNGMNDDRCARELWFFCKIDLK